MKRDYGSVGTIVLRASVLLQAMSRGIEEQRKEFDPTEYHQTYTRNAVAKLSELSRRIAELVIKEVEESDCEFNKKQVGNVEQYTLTIQNVIDIYARRQIPKCRDIHKNPYMIFVVDLRGGVSETVSTVTLAHALRVHQDSLHHDLHILVIDLDPQASSTILLDHTHSIGIVLETVAQAMLNDLDAETLREAVTRPTITPGVNVIPASTDDGFVASQWGSLVVEYLSGLKPSEVLRKTIIDRIAGDYNFVFIDTGPHFDPFLLNGLAASDLLLIPTLPAQVDLHSTLKYLTCLPEVSECLEEEGMGPCLGASIGFMSKMTSKRDHETFYSPARGVYVSNTLDSSLPRLNGFERRGESLDTITSANPVSYPGSTEALKEARTEAERFTKAVFDRIEYIRGASK